jgi:CheY-like chemotaxis protein
LNEASTPWELTYRSNAALLVAYATHLIRGQLLIETSKRIPNGTPLHLRLVAPATSIALTGVVSGTSGSAEATEIALSVTARAEVLGEAVDKLAFGFKGIKALVAASQAAPRALLIRYLRSIVTCEVIEIDQTKLSEPGAICNVDLAVIDLDSTGAAGYELYARLREHKEAGSAPVLAVAHLERDRARAASLGFDEALANPPAFSDLQAAALRNLARPVKVKFD